MGCCSELSCGEGICTKRFLAKWHSMDPRRPGKERNAEVNRTGVDGK